jgi:hypothetical protein
MISRSSMLGFVFAVGTFAPGIWAADSASAQGTPSQSAFNSANYSGGNGLSKRNAVVLKIASDSGGIASEYVWVAHTYPGSKVVEQALTTWDHGKRYDILTVQTADQAKLELWFEISILYK